MVIQFKNREREIKEINEVLGSKNFEFLVIYGRRRIGKTELVLKVSENKRRLYYLAVGEKNLERFYTVCSESFPDVSRLRKDWEALFAFLVDKVEVVIIDEFQNLIKEDKNILTLFQSITDVILKNSKLKLIVLGSSISLMTSKVLAYKSPLYGRKTASLHLRAISFFDLAQFFPKASIEQLVEVYGFADGIPHYLVKVHKEFWHWLREEIEKERSFIKDEVDFLMRYEFEDVSTYKLILEAIAHGKTKVNEIKDFIKVKRTDISPYLKNLIEVQMIERVVPLTENIKSRKGRYYISDNFLKFWFRYVYPNLSFIEERIFDVSAIRRDYTNYLGGIFEDITRQYLIKKRSAFLSFTKIGKWWHKDKEIDLVALNEKTKEILFVECKWKENIDAEYGIKNLREKAQSLPWNIHKRKEYYALFAKSFRKKIEEYEGRKVYCIDIEDMGKKTEDSKEK